MSVCCYRKRGNEHRWIGAECTFIDQLFGLIVEKTLAECSFATHQVHYGTSSTIVLVYFVNEYILLTFVDRDLLFSSISNMMNILKYGIRAQYLRFFIRHEKCLRLWLSSRHIPFIPEPKLWSMTWWFRST